MSGRPQRIYWDANCFLSYINEDPRWLSVLDILLEDANIHRSIEIVTSVISVAEVAFAAVAKLNRALSPGEEAKIDGFWTSPGITLVEVNERVARLGREIKRDDALKGRTGKRTADILHVATARFVRVQEMHTVDGDMKKYSNLYGFPIQDPYTPKMKLPGFSGVS